MVHNLCIALPGASLQVFCPDAQALKAVGWGT